MKHEDLPRLRALMHKYVARKREKYERRDPNEIDGRDIWLKARLYHADFLPFLEGRFDAMSISRNGVAQLARTMELIECGMLRKQNGEWVESLEPTRRPDQVHQLKFLNSGRPVLKIGRAEQAQAKVLRNPFKKGLA